MIRNIFNGISALLALSFVWTGCTQFTEYDSETAGRVETLLYPSDGFEIDLINNDNASLTFEWEASESGNPLYEVIIYGSDGVTEAGRFESDNNGADNMLNLPHKTIIELADMAGITPESTGDLYWTAVAVNGTNVQSDPPAPNKFTVTRDASVVGAPTELYITGEGSEGGADITKAVALYMTADGVFEIYTKINGAFSFVNRNAEGAKRAFYMTESGKLTENADNAVTASDAVYRVGVDFNTNSVSLVPISDVALYRAGNNDTPLSGLSYAGNGIWKTGEYTIPADGDDRYRFKVLAGSSVEVWGADNTERDAQDPGTIDPVNTYFNIGIHTDQVGLDDSYRSIFKFHSPLKGQTCNVVISMNGGRHYHYFDMGFELVAPVVENLVSPEEGASVELLSTEGAKLAFIWDKPADCPQLPLTSYTLKIYQDAGGSTELGSFDAGYSTSVEVIHLQLESIATEAGIAAGAEGTLYWGVESRLISYTAMSPVQALKVTRIKGIPDQLYLTGSATEYGTEYGRLKKLDIGKFEIYTKLSSGSYAFTDGTEGNIRKYVIDGDSVKESETDGNWNEENIYRINIDIIEQTATVEVVSDVFFIVGVHADKPIYYDYSGKGVWEAKNVVPDFTYHDWGGGDSRYTLYLSLDGTKYKLAAKTKDFGDGNDPATEYEEGDAMYMIYELSTDDNPFDYGFKTIQSYRGQNTKHVDLKINLGPDTEFYYNYIHHLE